MNTILVEARVAGRQWRECGSVFKKHFKLLPAIEIGEVVDDLIQSFRYRAHGLSAFQTEPDAASGAAGLPSGVVPFTIGIRTALPHSSQEPS